MREERAHFTFWSSIYLLKSLNRSDLKDKNKHQARVLNILPQMVHFLVCFICAQQFAGGGNDGDDSHYELILLVLTILTIINQLGWPRSDPLTKVLMRKSITNLYKHSPLTEI